jgi:hypothetical protein
LGSTDERRGTSHGGGKLKVKFEVTYTPDEGDPLTKPKKAKLVRKRR